MNWADVEDDVEGYEDHWAEYVDQLAECQDDQFAEEAPGVPDDPTSARAVSDDHEEENIGSALEDPCVAELILRGRRINNMGAGRIADAMDSNPSLVLLDLAVNRIGSAGARCITSALSRNQSIVTLILRENHLGNDDAGFGAALAFNSILTYLDLSGNDIGPEGCCDLSAGLEKNNTLTAIDLHYNHIGDVGARRLATVIEHSCVLRSVGLKSNSIHMDGAAALGAAIATNSSLRDLSLDWNHIGCEGGTHLAKALEENNGLERLTLQGACIGDDGAKRIAFALQTHRTLETLNLMANGIQDEGMNCLAKALGSASLTAVHLSGNEVTRQCEEEIANALKLNGHLKTLDIRGTVIGACSDSRVATALRENKAGHYTIVLQLTEDASVLCTSLAGEELACLEIDPRTEPLQNLRAALAPHLGHAAIGLHFVAIDGRALVNEAAVIADLLEP